MSKVPRDWELILWGFDHAQKFIWVNLGFSNAKFEFYTEKSAEQTIDIQTSEFSSIPIKIAHSFGLYGYSVTPKGARTLLNFCLPLRKRFISFPGKACPSASGGSISSGSIGELVIEQTSNISHNARPS